MSIVVGFNELTALLNLPFGSTLTQLTARIAEIYPAGQAPGGSRQQIRLSFPRGGAVDVHLFDQSQQVLQLFAGGVIRISASPNARNAFVWERSKADKPSNNMGALVVRKQATIELFTASQATKHGLSEFGFTRPAPPVACEPKPASPSPPRHPERSSVTPTAPIGNLTEQFAECLRTARATLGPDANHDDVMATAKAVFERLR